MTDQANPNNSVGIIPRFPIHPWSECLYPFINIKAIRVIRASTLCPRITTSTIFRCWCYCRQAVTTTVELAVQITARIALQRRKVSCLESTELLVMAFPTWCSPTVLPLEIIVEPLRFVWYCCTPCFNNIRKLAITPFHLVPGIDDGRTWKSFQHWMICPSCGKH